MEGNFFGKVLGLYQMQFDIWEVALPSENDIITMHHALIDTACFYISRTYGGTYDTTTEFGCFLSVECGDMSSDKWVLCLRNEMREEMLRGLKNWIKVMEDGGDGDEVLRYGVYQLYKDQFELWMKHIGKAKEVMKPHWKGLKVDISGRVLKLIHGNWLDA